MPELPEVEVTMRGIRPALSDATIEKVWFDDLKLRRPLLPELKKLEGAKVTEIKRRAKYIVVNTTNGSLLIHLGMTGHLSVLKAPKERAKHDHFELQLGNGSIIRYNDSRRFGLIWYYPAGVDPNKGDFLKDLGPEPLSEEFNSEYLYKALSRLKKDIKLSITDPKVVVGVGNIYASEVLFAARINPMRRSSDLSVDECEKLVSAIKNILARSIEQGGTTIINFQGADGKMGYFVQQLNVYGRKGKKCPVCGTEIAMVVLGQRSTFYCPCCQKN